MDYIDYYKELGIPKTASKEEIARAYRKGARKVHPDVNKAPGAEARFRRLTEAYEVLKDPEKRDKFDRFGAAWQQGGRAGVWPEDFEFHAGGGPGPRSAGAAFGGRTGTGGFSSFFEHLFGGGGAQANDARWDELFRRGGGPAMGLQLDQEARLELSLEEALLGGEQIISLPQPTGESKSLRVTVPAGATEGQRLRLKGQGGGVPGGPRGDLYLRICLRSHPRFRLEGHDLHTHLDVAPAGAALGGKVRLRTLDKEVSVRVPPGTSSGQRIRLRGQGWPVAGGRRGDLYAEVRIVVPAHLTPEERELYERLAGAGAHEQRTREPSTN